MNYIGEFRKNSTILLELLTKDQRNQPIKADSAPTAVIEHYNRNGLQQLDSVTLDTIEGESRYVKAYQIPPEWPYGNYVITYSVMIDGIQYTTQESFSVPETEDLIEENNILSYEILDIMTGKDEEDDIFFSSYDYQLPVDIEVSGKKLIITLQNEVLYNHTYQLVLDKTIKFIDGQMLGKTRVLTFTTEYKPLFSTPTEVRLVLKDLFRYFSPHDVYAAIRDASQKAMQLLGNIADPNNSRYRELRETDSSYFPSQKFVIYEASLKLMTSLMADILNNEYGKKKTDSIGGNINSMSLGDLQISANETDKEKEESLLVKLKTLIEETEKELKFWKDAMLGRNRRGYATPVSASYRTSAGSPTGRDFE